MRCEFILFVFCACGENILYVSPGTRLHVILKVIEPGFFLCCLLENELCADCRPYISFNANETILLCIFHIEFVLTMLYGVPLVVVIYVKQATLCSKT